MKPSTRVLLIAAAMGLVAVATAEAARAQATFSGLGYLPGGLESTAYAVSANGRVVVGSSFGASGLEAFRWQEGVMTGLGDLPGGAFSSVAAAVSADGQVIVGLSEGESGLEAFRWENGMMTGLGDLPGGDVISRADGVSADGSVIVGAAGVPTGWEAFRWEGGSMEGLGDLPGGIFKSYARGVSGDAGVIVGSGDSGDFEAARWVDGTIEGLGFLAIPEPLAEFQSLAYAVSADGSVIVGVSDNYRIVFDPYTGEYVTAQYLEPFRLQGGVMTSLFDGCAPGGPPPGQPWTFGIALAADSDGSVIVGYGYGAFVWDASNGMRDLQDRLESDFGLDLSGWSLDRATGVSADGTVIVGYGRNPVGNQEAWIAVLPQPESVPAFSASGLVIVAGCLLGTAVWGMRRRAPFQAEMGEAQRRRASIGSPGRLNLSRTRVSGLARAKSSA